MSRIFQGTAGRAGFSVPRAEPTSACGENLAFAGGPVAAVKLFKSYAGAAG